MVEIFFIARVSKLIVSFFYSFLMFRFIFSSFFEFLFVGLTVDIGSVRLERTRGKKKSIQDTQNGSSDISGSHAPLIPEVPASSFLSRHAAKFAFNHMFGSGDYSSLWLDERTKTFFLP